MRHSLPTMKRWDRKNARNRSRSCGLKRQRQRWTYRTWSAIDGHARSVLVCITFSHWTVVNVVGLEIDQEVYMIGHV